MSCEPPGIRGSACSFRRLARQIVEAARAPPLVHLGRQNAAIGPAGADPVQADVLRRAGVMGIGAAVAEGTAVEVADQVRDDAGDRAEMIARLGLADRQSTRLNSSH